MAVDNGTFRFPANLGVELAAPLDARNRVDNIGDLYNISFAYTGLKVYVISESSDYRCVNELQSDSAAGWERHDLDSSNVYYTFETTSAFQTFMRLRNTLNEYTTIERGSNIVIYDSDDDNDGLYVVLRDFTGSSTWEFSSLTDNDIYKIVTETFSPDNPYTWRATQNFQALVSGVNLRISNYLEILSTGAMKLPLGNTEQRPSSPVESMFRYNSIFKKLEYYDGTTWITLRTSGFTRNSMIISGNTTIDISVDELTLDITANCTLTLSGGGDGHRCRLIINNQGFYNVFLSEIEPMSPVISPGLTDLVSIETYNTEYYLENHVKNIRLP